MYFSFLGGEHQGLTLWKIERLFIWVIVARRCRIREATFG